MAGACWAYRSAGQHDRPYLGGREGMLARDRPSILFLCSWLPLLFCVLMAGGRGQYRAAGESRVAFPVPGQLYCSGILLLKSASASTCCNGFTNACGRHPGAARSAPKSTTVCARRTPARRRTRVGPLATAGIAVHDLDHFSASTTNGHDVGDKPARSGAAHPRYVALRRNARPLAARNS